MRAHSECMQAAVWPPPPPPWRAVVEEITVAAPRAGEVRVRMVSSAICHTDAYTVGGSDPDALFPCILGYAAAAPPLAGDGRILLLI